MRQGRTRRLIGVLAAVLVVIGYLSWQFGLFAKPHKAAPLAAPAPPPGGTTSGQLPAGLGEGDGGDRHGVAGKPETGGGTSEAAGQGDAPDGQGLPGARAQQDRLNILLLGVDTRAVGEPSRSDIMLLLSVNLVEREAALLSIPRDTRLEIPDRGADKVNHAHAFGGVDLAMQTVANAFQLPIHHWVRIDMAGMVSLIDQLGPITIDVPLQLTLQEGMTVGPGPVEMDGELALLYLRERHSDPEGDVGRAQRAGAFLVDLGRALIKEVSPADIPRFYTILRDHADTDIQLQDGLWQRALQISLDSVQLGTVKGRGRMIDGIYYYEVDWPATEQVLQQLRIHAPEFETSGGALRREGPPTSMCGVM